MEVLVFRDLSEKEITRLADLPSAKIYVSPEISQVFPFETTSIPLDLEATFQESARLTLAFPHQIRDGKPIAEHLSFQNYSLWYYTKFIFFNRFKIAFKEWSLYQKINPKNGEVLVFANSSFFKKMVAKNAKVELPQAKTSKLRIARFALVFALRTLTGWFLNLNLKKARHVFLYPPMKPQPILDKRTLKTKRGNPPVQYLLDDLQNIKGGMLLEEVYPSPSADLSFSRKNLLGSTAKKSLFFEPFLAGSLFSYERWKSFKNYRKKEILLFQKWLENEKDDTQRLMLEIAKGLSALRATSLYRLAAAERLFGKSRIQTVGGIDESGLRVKSLLEPAQKNGAKTYAVQHGAVYPSHLSYSFVKEDWQFTQPPDKTFVFGSHTRKVLEANNFPPEKIEVAGQLRTDIIPVLKEKNLRADLKLKPAGQTFLYTSQPLFGGEEKLRDRLNLDFFRLAKDFPQHNFVLKPHPREPDWDYFHQLARQVGTDNYLISNDDLYLLLNTADALLTYYSTVGAEAVYFDLPLIVMDYTGLDLAGYLADGVGIEAKDYQPLKKATAAILEGKTKPDLAIYSDYKQKYAGQVDGQVSRRILRGMGSGND